MIKLKKTLPYVVLISLLAITYFIANSTPSSSKRGARPVPVLTVEAKTIVEQDFQVILQSFGKIAPKTHGQLSSQVSGKVIKVSDKFNQGSFFNRGDVLVTIDARDFNIRVETAQAELAQAQVVVDQELALSEVAIRDRRASGLLDEATDLALRKPQLFAAKAKLQSASAKLKQAFLDVERTKIKAPYDGRILSKNVSIGQVINSNTDIAQIFATDVVLVKLPIKNSQLALIDLPNNRLNDRKLLLDNVENSIIIENKNGSEIQLWSAKLMRTTGEVDKSNQQINIIAEITQPFSHASNRALNINQFVSAKIKGKLFNNAIVVPNSAVYQGSYLYIIDNGTLQRRDIEIIYQDDLQTLIASGLSAGEQLVITPLGQISSGTPVKLLGATNKRGKKRGDRVKRNGERPNKPAQRQGAK
ncbi:MAG: efflux RND transporter periplasmic adaptor subunit [Psychrobium sp.]|nr:efflux RND transporter periplasmic adaptor subunit [Psychrobium sp.]